MAAATHDLAQLAPVDVGQADVEQDEIVALPLDALERLAAGRRLADGELIVKLELLGERLPERVVVVDDENAPAAGKGSI